MPEKNKKETETKKQSVYTMGDVIKITDDIFKLSQEKKYNLGAFIHSLIFASEYVQYTYKIPPKQIAEIRRDCRKYFQETIDLKTK